MEINYKLLFGILEVMYLLSLSAAQIVKEELQELKIDPLNLNGTEPYTELTIDQIIMRASGGPGMAQNLMLTDDGTVLAELDMRLTHDQFYNLYEQPESTHTKRSSTGRKKRLPKRNKRKAIKDTILRWKDAVVPYKFVTGHFDEKEQYMIHAAMTEWEKYTCLRFKPASSTDYNLVRFQNGYGCNSQLGMVGGQQPLNLDKNGCRFKGLYLHEIGHAVGLVHEHQLPNRDNYIEILYHNVEPNMRIWFNKYSSQEVDQMRVPYEYSSVMHYGVTAFSSDGKSQTIRAKYQEKEKTIGRVYRKELSFTDVKIVNLMYNCARECDKSIVCNDEGYVDQNCKCICKDGTDSCTKNTIPNDPSCFNAMESWQCNIWANQGECTRNPRFMLESCKKACRLCGEKEAKDDTCEDSYPTSKCQVWKGRGECIVNKDWMGKFCKQTCKACSGSGTDPSVACSNAHGKDADCDKWAAEGECQINPYWMPENCRKSCHMCGDKTNTVPTTTPEPEPQDCENKHNTQECDGWAKSGECEVNPDWMIPNCRKACRKCGDSGATECINTWDDAQCAGWARDQECLKNSVWMNRNCHKACTNCDGDATSTGTTSGGKTQTTGRPTYHSTESSSTCTNNHRNDKECDTWATYGHCDINPWMKIHCAKACKVCQSVTLAPTTARPEVKTGGTDRVMTTERTTTSTSQCIDKEHHCPAWAKHNFCKDNPSTALRICKKSCGACTSGINVCKDNHQLCPVWANGGQCRQNSGYMLLNCQKSCNTC